MHTLAPGVHGLRNLGMRALARRRRSAGAPADLAEIERVVYERIYGYPRRYIDNIRPIDPLAMTKTRPRRVRRKR